MRVMQRWPLVCILLALCACARETKNVGTGGFGGPYFGVLDIGHIGQAFPGSEIELHVHYYASNGIANVEWELGSWADPPALAYTETEPRRTYHTASSSRSRFESVRTVRIVDQGLSEPLVVEAKFKITASFSGQIFAPVEGKRKICLLPPKPPEPEFGVEEVGPSRYELSTTSSNLAEFQAVAGEGIHVTPDSGSLTANSSAEIQAERVDPLQGAQSEISVLFNYQYLWYEEGLLYSNSSGSYRFGSGSPVLLEEWREITKIIPVRFDPPNILPDTLYAIPLQSTINAGERVRIVVISGDPANPFFYVSSIRITVPKAADAKYVGSTAPNGGTGDVPGSFNVGAVGGNARDPDGIWEDQGATSFLLAPDNFIQRSDAGGGLHGIDFNVTPLDGSDMADGDGALFNIELEFPNAGTYELGFQDINVVNRTYYQDSSLGPEFFWGDITNNHAGVPNSVTVF